VAAVNPDQPKR